jgi:hypothetical protein
MSHLKVQSFLHAESQGIDCPEVGRHSLGRAVVDDGMNLLDRKNFRQALDVLEFHLGQGFPVSLAGSGVEELDSREGDTQGTISEIPFVLEVEKESAKLIFGNLVRGRLAVVRQLTNGAKVAGMRPLAHASEVQVIGHALIELASKGLRLA